MKRADWANSLRGIAALTVVVAHFGVVFWMNQEGAGALARHEPLWSGGEGAPVVPRVLASLPVEFGALGVALFFLLSGYVIAISIERYQRRGFLVGRLLRVLPTYAAGFLVTCAVVALAGDPGGELDPLHVALGTVPGLAQLLNSTAPADGIVWTLIVELGFYGVCLLLYRALVRVWYVVLGLGVACVLVVFLLTNVRLSALLDGAVSLVALVATYLPVMLIGCVLSAYDRGHFSRLPTALLAVALAAAYGVTSWLSPLSPDSLKYRASFLLAVLVFLGVWLLRSKWGGVRPLEFAADISYPLYVVHAVAGYAILARLVAAGVWPIVAFLVATVTAVGLAWVLHLLVESPTHRLGQRLARRFGYAQPEPQSP